MLRGDLVGLRARQESDVAILHAELFNDVAMHARSDTRAWVPVPTGPESQYAIRAATPEYAPFSVEELSTGELAGEAVLWGIDLHNRSAHLGLSLRPAFRGRGLGLDTVRVLTEYGFRTRGLHRLQLETLADNDAMIRAATEAGYRREGTMRAAAWVSGTFIDDVMFGRLADDAM